MREVAVAFPFASSVFEEVETRIFLLAFSVLSFALALAFAFATALTFGSSQGSVVGYGGHGIGMVLRSGMGIVAFASLRAFAFLVVPAQKVFL